MAAALLVGLPAGEAQAGGRLAGARSAVRPSSGGSSGGFSRPSHVSGAPVRVHVRSAPPPAPTVRTRVTTTVIVRRTVPPQAVPPPVPLGPEATPVNLQGPPPRPPFQRFVHRFPY